ncbi:fungal cellulose binding domain-containing protein [Phlyctema vagabunda]|uniref:lytic cellulose monooxygenase (C4-dehydrogenating) n=1 Tax=Phlyctema vagabunda TaxID=108571 RepID=A0ABR4PEH4_9HELO
MKLLSPSTLLSLLPLTTAHYTLPSLIYGGATTPAWTNVRQWTGYYTNNPVTDVTSLDIRCNVGASTVAASTLNVVAGQPLGFSVAPDIYHAGPALVYLAKVPTGKDAATWDGSGAVWFKIYQIGPQFGGSALVWPTDSATSINFTIPKNLPNGQYLVRGEHIGLHTASSAGAAQFYISCGQINVTGGGSGTPGPLVSFPGAYKATDPGLMINIYYPVPTSYTFPGPAVWTG